MPPAGGEEAGLELDEVGRWTSLSSHSSFRYSIRSVLGLSAYRKGLKKVAETESTELRERAGGNTPSQEHPLS